MSATTGHAATRTMILIGALVFLSALVATTLYKRQAYRRAQDRVEDLAVLATHYLWELDRELARQSAQVIVDSEGYRELRIVSTDGSTFVQLTPQQIPRWDPLLSRVGLAPSETHEAPLVHRDRDGQPAVIGTLIVQRPDTDIFVYLQVMLVMLLAGLATRAWLERRRQLDTSQRLQLAEEKATRLEAEARAEQRERQLQEKRSLESLGRLSAGIAHDFNNVLTVIINTSEIIAEDGDDEQTRALARAILDAADRAAGLTRQLLAFGRRQVREPQALDLNAVIRSFRPILERAAGDQIRLRLELSPTLGIVEADPSQIEQILLNLVVNSQAAMPEGGSLTIETCDIDGPGAVPGGAPLPGGRWAVLAVHDTGEGMNEETLSRAFEPFFTTRPEGKGTGLGLATVFGITHQSGGEVTAASSPGRGTTITVALPRVDRPATELPAPMRSIPPGELTVSATVMLVEDRRQVREVMARALRSHGFQVLEAEDGLMALTLARDLATPIETLVTDLTMPGISGVELARRMRAEMPQLMVLYVSGDAAAELPADFVPDARTAVLHKPFGANMLVGQVIELLDAARSL